MLERITLQGIDKNNCELKYSFCVTNGLKQYFSDIQFVIEYPENIEQVPNAVLAVPFVANVLPIIWLTDSTLFLDELDETFYNSILEFKKGYEEMFPDCTFAGSIQVSKLVKCDSPAIPGKSAMFFSGGLDSVQTLISHFEEKPELISIWGADIQYNNESGWRIVHDTISETAERFNLDSIVIHSSFREFDNEGELGREFGDKLHDGWWHGVKHGIAIISHAAPIAYLHNLSILYIAASSCSADGKVICASNPIIDNYVRFADCQVVHDGFEFSRQDKTHNIVEFCNKNSIRIPLHVCWESQQGGNCCHCEKCLRTIIGIIIEGGDPIEFGFNDLDSFVNENRSILVRSISAPGFPMSSVKLWIGIQSKMKANMPVLKMNPYWKNIMWITKVDFQHPEMIKAPMIYRVKNAKGIRGKLSQFKFYQFLHRVKEKLK